MTNSLLRIKRATALFLMLCVSNIVLSKGLSLDVALKKKPSREMHCLSVALYEEARGESVQGQYAVASVIINRSLKDNTSICSTLQKAGQFAWDTSKLSKPLPKDSLTQQAMSRTVVTGLMLGIFISSVGDALFFLSGNIRPTWVENTKLVRQIGGHKFFSLREKQSK